MKINRIIFIVLVLMVVSLVGCGHSGYDNPAADRGNGGLVNVRGSVSNVSESAKVTFYTPETAMKNGLTNANMSARASMNNEGVYTTDTDKSGNYSITIPENTYYVFAEEGDKMTAPARQSFSARAAMTTVEDIVLTKTTDVKGSVLDSAGKPVANVPVFIENTPFMCVSNASGNFTFNKVPQLATSATYSVVAYTCINGVRYIGSHSLTSTEQTNKTAVKLQLKQDTSSNSKKINGYVYYKGTTNPVSGQNVIAILPSGQAYSTTSGSDGKYTLEVATTDTAAQLTVDMITFTDASIPTSTDVALYVDTDSPNSVGNLVIVEKCDKDYDDVFQNSVNTFVILKNGEKYTVDTLGTPVANYVVADMPAGTYHYAFVGETLVGAPMFGCKFTEDFTISAGKNTNVTAEHTVCFVRPTIQITNDGYYAVNIDPSVKSDDTAAKCATVNVYAADSDGNITTLSYGAIGKEIEYAARIDLSKLTVGEHKLWIEVKFDVNGYDQSFKSDEYPYVKHN